MDQARERERAGNTVRLHRETLTLSDDSMSSVYTSVSCEGTE